MNDEVPAGLRERRRRETTADIRRSAIDLIESEGWEATTVAGIAARAGISSRTFFRYFDSKEQAVLPGHRRLWDAVVDFTPSELTPARAATELGALLRRAADGDGDPVEIEEHRRIARLFQSNPHLHAVAAVQEADFGQHLHGRLRLLMPDENPLLLRALAESSMAVWRTGWWHWGTELSLHPDASPADSFAAAEKAMRAAVELI